MSKEFLTDLDLQWQEATPEKIPLKLIGSTALMLQANYTRITKDSDVLEVEPLTPAMCERLLALAGPGTEMHRRHKLYLDMVRPGLPFLPPSPTWHELPDFTHLVHFRIHVLDVVDVVVSKFARFSTNDQSDIDAMIDRDLVPHDLLIVRFKAAVDGFEMDARADKLPRYIGNLHRVERDSFNIDPTTIEVPAGVVEPE
jgi:hypothetical protein